MAVSPDEEIQIATSEYWWQHLSCQLQNWSVLNYEPGLKELCQLERQIIFPPSCFSLSYNFFCTQKALRPIYIMKGLLSPETWRKILEENVIAEQKCYEGHFGLRGGEGQVFNLETKGLNPTLWAGFPWGLGGTKPFCWLVAFSSMGRARPAGDEHVRYTPSSEAELSKGSADWGQAWRA